MYLPSPSTLALFLGAITLVAVSPGPAVLYVMALAARGGGVRASLPGIAGLQFGALLFFAAVGTGLAALLMALTPLFTAVKVAGALYLCWLGLGLIRSSRRSAARGDTRSAPGPDLPPARAFWQGLLVQVTNPKAFLFATALLPQFLDPRQPMFAQVALLFVLSFAIDATSMLVYAALAARGVGELRSSTAVVWLERLFGAALIGFGIHLALSRL